MTLPRWWWRVGLTANVACVMVNFGLHHWGTALVCWASGFACWVMIDAAEAP